MLIINWANGAQICHSPRLLLIIEEVLLLKKKIDFISIMNVYRERNRLADRLSKEGAKLLEGQIQIDICYTDGHRGFYHQPL